jgi:hypothetical protein
MKDSVITMLMLRPTNGPAPWLYLIALLPPILLCTIAGLQPYIDTSELFRDSLVVAQDAADNNECCHAYYGSLSMLGGLIWVGSAFVATFAATVLFNRENAKGASQFMIAAGALTLILVVDDMFMGHETVYRALFGIPQRVTIAIYALLVVAYLLNFRRLIIEVGPGLLIISLLAFAISVATDLFVPPNFDWLHVMEDGAKLVGIFCWTTFHCWASWILLDRSSRVIASPTDPKSMSSRNQ